MSETPRLLAGLVVGVGIGVAASSTVGRQAFTPRAMNGRAKAAEPEGDAAARETEDRVRALEVERDAMAAKVEDANRLIEALKESRTTRDGERERHKSEPSCGCDKRNKLSELEQAQRRIQALEQEVQRGARAAEALQDARSQVETLTKARDEMDGLRVEAMRQAEILEKEQEALQRELASSKQRHQSEASSLRRSVTDAQDELSRAKAERDAMREKVSNLECKVKTLRSEVDSSQATQDSMSDKVLRSAEFQRQALTFRSELDAANRLLREKSHVAMDCAQARKQVMVLSVEMESMTAGFDEARHVITSLRAEEDSLRSELAALRRQRKDSLKDFARGLADIGAKLDTAETSWSPWTDINDVRERVGSMQKEALEDEDGDGSQAVGSRSLHGA